jgi:hypothetical protein
MGILASRPGSDFLLDNFAIIHGLAKTQSNSGKLSHRLHAPISPFNSCPQSLVPFKPSCPLTITKFASPTVRLIIFTCTSLLLPDRRVSVQSR